VAAIKYLSFSRYPTESQKYERYNGSGICGGPGVGAVCCACCGGGGKGEDGEGETNVQSSLSANASFRVGDEHQRKSDADDIELGVGGNAGAGIQNKGATRRAQEARKKEAVRRAKLAAAEDPLAPLRKMFETFDANHDGTVSFEELKLSLDALGRKPTEVQIKHMIDIVGGNHEAGINFEEFCQFMAIHSDYLNWRQTVHP
jgi:hypothetical protein